MTRTKHRPLLALGTIVAVLVMTEAYLRLAPNRSPEEFVLSALGTEAWVEHPFLPYVGRPRYKHTRPQTDAGHPVTIENNSSGFRSKELPTEKQEQDYFIVCLGGSTTWGEYAETNADTWPEILERLLAERYPSRSIKVFNLGAPLADSVYSIVTLSLIGVHIRPDLIIDYEGWNDIAPTIAWNYRSDDSHFFTDLDAHSIGIAQRHLPEWMLSIRTVALATFWIENWAGTGRLGTHVLKSWVPWPDVRLSSERILRNFKTIDSIARGHGARAIFSTFQFFDGPTFATLPLLNGEISRSDLFRHFFEEQGLAYVDQDRLIPDGDSTLQVDTGHFTAKGEALMAKNFADYIVAQRFINE